MSAKKIAPTLRRILGSATYGEEHVCLPHSTVYVPVMAELRALLAVARKADEITHAGPFLNVPSPTQVAELRRSLARLDRASGRKP